MLDSPVSGSVVTLEQGQVSLMVGGDAAAQLAAGAVGRADADMVPLALG